MPDIVTLGQKTHYMDDCFTAPFEGTPQTILIQHGFGRNSNGWYEWVPLLSGKYRVIRRDARGHGQSSAPDRSEYDWSVETMLAEIIDMLDQLNIDKVHFLGESTSGMLGMALAAKYPERLHSLIICSSPTFLPPGAMKLFSMGMGSWQEAIRTLGSEGWARELGKLPGTGGRKDAVFFEWWAKMVGESPAYGLEQYSLFLEGLDGRKYMPDINVPTLILAPKNSTATPVSSVPRGIRVLMYSDQESMARQIKGSKIVFVNGAGHEIYVDKAAECVKEINEFIDNLNQKK